MNKLIWQSDTLIFNLNNVQCTPAAPYGTVPVSIVLVVTTQNKCAVIIINYNILCVFSVT